LRGGEYAGKKKVGKVLQALGEVLGTQVSGGTLRGNLIGCLLIGEKGWVVEETKSSKIVYQYVILGFMIIVDAQW